MTSQGIANKVVNKNPTLFRNDNGVGYHGGKPIFIKKDGILHVKKGQLLLINPRYFSYGLYPGSGDFVGWKPITITQEMAGQTIAVFHSIEVKTEHDNLSKKQRKWNKAVIRDGGIAEVWKEKKGKIVVMKGDDII